MVAIAVAIFVGVICSSRGLISSLFRIKCQQWELEVFPVLVVLFHFLEAKVSLYSCTEWTAAAGLTFMKK